MSVANSAGSMVVPWLIGALGDYAGLSAGMEFSTALTGVLLVVAAVVLALGRRRAVAM